MYSEKIMLVHLHVSCLKLSQFTYTLFHTNSVRIFHDESCFGPQVSITNSAFRVGKMGLRKAPYKRFILQKLVCSMKYVSY
jgi:hypothetical protein